MSRKRKRAQTFAARVLLIDVRAITERNLDVMEGVRDGLSHAGIAAKLHISVKTVEWHIKKVMDITGTASQTAAVAVLMARGLL